MSKTPDEQQQRGQAIKKAFETNDFDEVFNEQLKAVYDVDTPFIDRISVRKSAVFYMIANAHCKGNITFNNIFHMYIAALLFGFHLGHDYVAKYGAIPEEEIDEEEVEKLLNFEEEE